MTDCKCGWCVEPHGELMAEPEPDCLVHFPENDPEGLALVQAIHDRKAAQ